MHYVIKEKEKMQRGPQKGPLFFRETSIPKAKRIGIKAKRNFKINIDKNEKDCINSRN